MPDDPVVVDLGQFERSRRFSAATLSILHASRDLLIEGVSRALTRQIEPMENTLLALAERSPLLEARNACYAAQSILNRQANGLMTACKEAYCTGFDAFVRGRVKNAGLDLSKLALVDEEDFEITLALDKATSRLRFNCAEELVALDARVAHLLGRPDLPENDNPLGPRALCEALHEGIARFEQNQATQAMLLNQFDLVLATELAAIYQSLNQYLIDQNVLPDLKAGSRKRPTAQGTPPGASATAGQPEGDMLKLFEQLAHRGGQPDAMAGITGTGLLDSLSQLQKGGGVLLDGIRFELPLLEAATIHNVLRSLQQSAVMQTASPLDAVLVDAVATLFDAVFDEPGVPDRLKAQIARLQIPVLKAAMLDRSFFAQQNHPVRRMLDAIAALAVYLSDDAAGHAKLEAVAQIVGRVADSFDRDVAVFDSAAAELEAMDTTLENSLDEAASAKLEERIAALKRTERAELAPVIVRDLVQRALEDQPVADTVRTFLQHDWARLLTTDYVNDGEQSAHFNSHVETMRELIWSVQPKPDMDARLMLVRILPGLLKRLREGVTDIGLPQKQADHFFAGLVILHANSVRPANQAAPLPPVPALQAEEETAPALDGLEADSAGAAEPSPPEIEDVFTGIARALGKGDWVEFHYDDGTFRWARVAWVSGMKNTYLFSDKDGMSSFSIGLHRLADKLRTGEAVRVERRSITESAFGKLTKLFREKLGLAH
ncbi:MAG TPA: DUF1631 domain-containing protein [Thiobacillaceae bacterium]|nr:DUF1631 domain-containing protein [Thiobacillaceae bacterium]